MIHHLVVLKRHYLDCILQGRKTAECRLSRNKRAPFGMVAAGDLLWLKQSSGPVRATATVRRVEYFYPLAETVLANLQHRYAKSLQADQTFFEDHQHARYATVIQLSRVHRIEQFRLNKTDRHAWVVLPAAPVPYRGHC